MKISIFQTKVALWMGACFGWKISEDKIERNHRFLEEALELVQACNCTKKETLQLVDYVFDRPVGEISQEVGGVMITLNALCHANLISLESSSEKELSRIWDGIEKIRDKQARKPNFSPLPLNKGEGECTGI